MNIRRHLKILLPALLIAACAPSKEMIVEQLDPGTAATLTFASSPLVFYNDNSAYAAHSRNYVYVGPVRVNNMGNYRYYLWFGIWGTIPSSPPSAERDGFESVTLCADGEPLQMDLAGWSPGAIGASESVYVKPVASAAAAYYEVTIDQIRLIAESRALQLRVGTTRPKSYTLWDKQGSANASIRAFIYGEY